MRLKKKKVSVLPKDHTASKLRIRIRTQSFSRVHTFSDRVYGEDGSDR